MMKSQKLPAYSFKTIALCYHPRSEDKTIRAEIGIFLSHGYNLRYLKVWIPHRHQIYSMRHIKPLKYQLTPPSWNYMQNKRGNLPIQDSAQDSHNPPTVTTRNTDPEESPPTSTHEGSYGPNNQQSIDKTRTSTPTSRNFPYPVTENRSNFPSLNREGEHHRRPEIDQEGEDLTHRST